jgi:hypothetical protein
MLAGGALDLTAGVAGVALQRLIAMGAIEFEFGGAHKLHRYNAQTGGEKYIKDLFILLVRQMRM